MNKRSGPTGLPTKPYMPHAPAGPAAHGPGPAPPLPTGPPPQQAYGQVQGQDPAAAHAAAWAAYYQAQAQAAPAQQAYAGPAQPGAPVAGGANPYANYGYGAGAQHSSTYPQAGQPAQPVAGPSQPYRPPPNTQAYATAATQPSMLGYPQQHQYAQQGQVFSPQGAAAAGYQTPQPQARPPYQAPQQPAQQGYAWGAPQPAAPVVPTGPAYRPPQPQPQAAQGYQAPQTGPFYPQQPSYNAPTQPYRPPRTPQPVQLNSPYRPPMGNQARPPRPPMSTPPHPSGAGFPPAKRPRFDGPGGSVNGGQPGNAAVGGVGMNNVRPPSGPSMQNVRPPTAPAAFGAGTNGGQPGFNTGVPSRPSGIGRGGAPIPVSRPPIHLGGGGPLPQIGLGGVSRGAATLRGGVAGRGRGGGPINAPRGPSGMRRPDTRNSLPPKREPGKEKVREKKKEVESRTTMTDFRIVGIEVKEIGWSWGRVDGKEDVDAEAEQNGTDKNPQAESETTSAGDNQAKTSEVAAEATEVAATEHDSVEVKQEEVPAKDEKVIAEEAVTGEAVKAETSGESDASVQVSGDAGAITVEAVEEKRGEKRKAKSPDAEDETLSKKRSPYLLTHNKPNHASTSTGTSGETFDSNQNRFRIYFDSPPELDRIPKAERKNAAAQAAVNPHKRGRRESSSVAPSRAGDAVQDQQEHEEQASTQDAPGVEPVIIESLVENAGSEAEEKEPKENGEAVEGEGEGVEQTEGLTEAEVPLADPDNGVGIAPVIAETPVAPEVTLTPQPAEPVQSDIISGVTQAEAAAGAEQIGEIVEQPTVVEAVLEQPETAEAGDVSMLTDPGAIAEVAELGIEASLENVEPDSESAPLGESVTEVNQQSEQPVADEPNYDETKVNGEHPPTENAEDISTPLAQSAEAAASGHKTRTRRHSSVSNDSHYTGTVAGDVPNIVGSDIVPSTNRLSILYEKSSRRICLDSDVVEKVRIWRKEGRIEVEFKALTGEGRTEGEETVVDLPKGILIENYDTTDQRFVPLTRAQLSSFYPSGESPTAEGSSIPPFHKSFLPRSETADGDSSVVKANGDGLQTDKKNGSTTGVVLTVYLNKKNPLSEPKWCRTNSADGWLLEQFGMSSRKQDKEGWTGKLEVMDPDPAPTLRSILESWSSSSSVGTSSSRQSFTASLLSSPLDTLEILLRLTRGERNSAYSPSSTSAALASAVRADSPYASHQTHVSLAVLAMYRLTTDYAERVGGSAEKSMVEEKVGDIIRSLPSGMIHRSLEGMWREWSAGQKEASQQTK
ncbi:hypothetical protein IAT40_002580 [Kwoniella sp. CBS 6097]